MDGEQAFKAICDPIPEAMKRHTVPGVASACCARARICRWLRRD